MVGFGSHFIIDLSLFGVCSDMFEERERTELSNGLKLLPLWRKLEVIGVDLEAKARVKGG